MGINFRELKTTIFRENTVNKAKKIAQPGTKWFKAENGTKRSVNLCRSFVQNPTTHLFEQFEIYLCEHVELIYEFF